MADEKCSGKSECEIIVAFLAYHGPKPCPLELSSYMEASFTCVNGRHIFRKKIRKVSVYHGSDFKIFVSMNDGSFPFAKLCRFKMFRQIRMQTESVRVSSQCTTMST